MNGDASVPGRFDFGLTEAQEARAAKLHADSIVFDWLSQHVGGPNIFAAYPPDLQAEFRAMIEREGPGYRTYFHAMYWPYQMAYEGRCAARARLVFRLRHDLRRLPHQGA